MTGWQWGGGSPPKPLTLDCFSPPADEKTDDPGETRGSARPGGMWTLVTGCPTTQPPALGVEVSRLHISGITSQQPSFSLTRPDQMLPWWLSGKESTCQCRRLGFDPNYGRSPGEGNGNPLQYSCLGNPWTEEPGGLQCLPNSCETLNFGSLNPHASLQNGSCPAQLGEELELIYSSLYTVVGFLSIKENLSFNQITSMLLYCLKVIKTLK